jgi:hypothetical protein
MAWSNQIISVVAPASKTELQMGGCLYDVVAWAMSSSGDMQPMVWDFETGKVVPADLLGQDGPRTLLVR